MPPALTDPSVTPARGDLDLDPVLWEKAGVRPTARPPCWCRWSTRRAGRAADPAHRALPTTPGRSRFPAARSIRPTKARSPRRCARPRKRSGSTASFIEPIGYLDLYLTTFGFRILPLVARVEAGLTLTLNPGEVAEAFEVPLEFLMEPANHQRHTRDWKGMSGTITPCRSTSATSGA